MSDDKTSYKKLDAVRTAEEAAEKELMLELSKVKDICEKRDLHLSELKSKERILIEKLRSLTSERKLPALLMGEVSSAANVQAVLKIVSKDLENYKNQIEQASQELKRARDREFEVENNLREVRTKQKQIDKIVENRQSISKIISDANEEIAIEELIGQKKK